MAEINAPGSLLRDQLERLGKKIKSGGYVRVGFLEGATYPDGTSVAMVAAINNFGAPAKGIPPRPFFTNVIRSNSAEWGAKLGKILAATDWDTHRSLELIGEVIAGDIRQSIVDTNGPPNSPVTNLLKQRFPTGDGMTFADVVQAWRDVANGQTDAPAGKPLVWSGHMLDSVSAEVTDG